MSASCVVEDFNGTSWSLWIERLTFYFVAHGIDDPVKKRAHLLTRCGQDIFATVRALLAPKNLHDVPYEEIVHALQRHFEPKPAELLSRSKFHKRDQLPSETISGYVAALRSIAKDCNFVSLSDFVTPSVGQLPDPTSPTTLASRDSTTPSETAGATIVETTVTDTSSEFWPSSRSRLPLEVMLRDRFICGIRDANLQQRLLAEGDLGFDRALRLALASESAANQQATIQASKQELSVNIVKHKRQFRGSKECFRCDGDHLPSECPHKHAVCRFCGKKGHVEKACFTKKNKSRKSKQKSSSTHYTSLPVDASQRDSSSDLFTVNSLNKTAIGAKYTVRLFLNNRPLIMEVDSGASCSIVSEQTFKSLWPRNSPQLDVSALTLNTWTGQTLNVQGAFQVTVRHKKRVARLPLFVARGDGPSLVGRNWFPHLGINITGVNFLQGTTLQEILGRYSSVFSSTLDGHVGQEVHIDLKSEACPKFLKCRPVPFAIRGRVLQELDRLQDQGILEPVQASAWATPLVVVRKKDGSLRLCGDYRSTVNAAVQSSAYPLPSATELLAAIRGGKFFSS